MDGIVNVLKPTGMTSHDVVASMRRIYNMKKIGHAGTLDPLAAGVLPVYLGKATRLIEYGDDDNKVYHGEFLLGLGTDTEDITGQLLQSLPVPSITRENIERVLKTFTGNIEQLPSRFSAIKIGGLKAYDLARRQIMFDIPSRSVHIEDLSLLWLSGNRGLLHIQCSKGTYIRSLIRDIGTQLHSAAIMTYLVRLRVGNFIIDKASTLEEIAADPLSCLQPLDAGIQHLVKVNLPIHDCNALAEGRYITVTEPIDELGTYLRAYTPNGEFIGIVQCKNQYTLCPHKILCRQLK
jgi:tRNA pseudouridine55 synthase